MLALALALAVESEVALAAADGDDGDGDGEVDGVSDKAEEEEGEASHVSSSHASCTASNAPQTWLLSRFIDRQFTTSSLRDYSKKAEPPLEESTRETERSRKQAAEKKLHSHLRPNSRLD